MPECFQGNVREILSRYGGMIEIKPEGGNYHNFDLMFRIGVDGKCKMVQKTSRTLRQRINVAARRTEARRINVNRWASL